MLEFFKNLLRGSFVYGLGSILVAIISFFLLPVYTRFLTPSDYGILETLTTTTSILTIFLIFGMDNALFRFSFDSPNEQQQKRVLSTTSVFLWSICIVVITLLILNSGFFSQLLFQKREYTILLVVAFLAAGVAVIYKIPMSMFRIHNQPVKYTYIAVAQTLLTASLSVFFVVVLKKGVFGVISGSLIAAGLVTAVAYYLIRHRVSFAFSFKLLKNMLNFAIPVIPAGLSLWVLSLSDRYFLLAYSTTTELGLYSIGSKFASVVTLIIAAFRLAWPQAAFSILNKENRNLMYARTLTYFVLVSCSIVLGISLFGSELVRLMTTEAFYRGARVIPILALGLVFNGCFTLLTTGMGVTKKMMMIFPVTAIPAGLNLLLNYFLIPPYGMMGAAWATLISYVLMAFLAWMASERVYHIDYEWRRLFKIFSIIIPILALGCVISFHPLLFSVLFKLSLLAVYVALLYALKFLNKEEYTYLKNLYNKLRRRNKIQRQ